MAPQAGSVISHACSPRPAAPSYGGMCGATEYRTAVVEWCGERVVVGRDLAAAKPHGPFWLILDSVGPALSAALGMLQSVQRGYRRTPGRATRQGNMRGAAALWIGNLGMPGFRTSAQGLSNRRELVRE